METKTYIEQLVNEILIEDEFFLVDVEIKPGKTMQVFLDGDNGISITKCAKIGRELINRIDEDGIYDRGEVIEVSSPGIDQAITNPRQYNKNINRHFNIVLNNESSVEAKLIAIDENRLTLEEEVKEKGKKKEIKTIIIDLDEIKEAKVVVKF